jgi:phenylacetic acid degradation operon negative regulatory protein
MTQMAESAGGSVITPLDKKNSVCYIVTIMPIKDRRTKILLLLFLMPNLSAEALAKADVDFDFLEISPTLQAIFDLSLNQKTKGTISGMMREGLIEKQSAISDQSSVISNQQQTEQIETDNRLLKTENCYRLTNKGYRVLCLQFPFFRFLKEEWDGLWRVISYEIPETKREIRDRLRREMRGWGLGPWHRSFWLTPHPIISNLKDLVYGREEEKYIQAFESTHVFGYLNLLVEKVWQKSELDKKYRQLFKEWHAILSGKKSKEEKMKEIIAFYIGLLRLDPGLPQSLMGRNWIGFEAFSIFCEVKNILLR